MRRLRSKLTYANVMATIAVFIALGGASYAAIEIPKNSVGTKELKDGAVSQAKLAKKVKKALAQAGTPGPAGPAGAPGVAGAPGSARGYVYINTTGTFDPAKSKGVIDVRPTCASGPTECTAPPAPEKSGDYCFKLDFVPSVIVATPEYGRSYSDDAADRVEGKIPGRGWSELRGGCAPGYRDAEVRLYKANGNEVYGGLFVMFN
jgi:hypothetical protein